MRRSVFYIAKMDCPTEEQLIRNRMKSIKGIEQLDFDLMQRQLTVTHALEDNAALLDALHSIGMEPKEVMPRAAGTNQAGEHPVVISRLTWILMSISGAAAVSAEAVAWGTGRETSLLVIGLALLSIITGGKETLRKGWVSVRTFTLNINFLMTLAILGAVCIGQWPEAAMVTFLFGVAEMIEAFSLERARNAIHSLMAMSPEMAVVKEAGEWREVRASDVQVGQIVRVRPGERIPLDGFILSGMSSVNQAPITGESMPVEKKTGDTVFAGSVNERGAFEFRVTANQGNTTLARIIRTVQEAQAQRAPTQRFVDSFARYYTPGVVIFALLVAAIPTLFFGQAFAPWLYKALVMLVIACPCALIISTPVTVVSGLAAAARIGILVKGGIYLEEGRKIKVIALDKTGTLTYGKPAVTDVVPLNGQAWEELLHWIASLNAQSEHPVATAIVERCAQSHGTERCILLPVTDFEALIGRGVKGKINDQTYYVGSHRLTEENQVCGPHVEAVLNRLEQEGKTAVVLTSEREAMAVLGVADTLRETSVDAVEALHALGVRTVMLTGDNETTARAIAARVGIDDVRANLLPEDKLTAITTLRTEYGAVGMVGDGINDAPALAQASIGFAMGAAGTDTALESADVALMEDDLGKLPLFLALSRLTAHILTQNIALALGIKAVFFALALAGKATLWMAVFADMGTSLLVVFNGLRLLRYKKAASS